MTQPAAAADIPAATTAFAYRAQTPDGRATTGTIDAPHLDDASAQLQALGLRVTTIRPIAELGPAKPKPLRGDDFIAFNDQLAHLAAAGLPVEQGLRLLAQDLREGRLAATVRAVADELDRGVSLAGAIEKHRAQFPPLYSKLVDAGIKSGDLGAMLLNFGRHVEAVQRLRASIWQAAAYPLMVGIALAVVVGILGLLVLPQFADAFAGMGFGVRANATRVAGGVMNFQNYQQPRALPLPWITEALMVFGRVVPWFALALVLAIVAAPLAWRAVRAANLSGAVTDSLLVRLPLIGRALRLNLVARWCETLRLGVVAGLDLPAALRLAGETIDSPALRRDTDELVSAVERGLPLENAATAMSMLPPVVPPMIGLAARSNDLPASLGALTNLYQQQADVRTRTIPTVLMPILMIVVAAMIGFVVAGLISPMLRLFNWIMRGEL